MVDKNDLLSLLFVEGLHNPLIHKCKSLMLTKYHVLGQTSPEQVLSDHFEEFMGILVPALLTENLVLNKTVKDLIIKAPPEPIYFKVPEGVIADDFVKNLQERINSYSKLERGI